ncbi:MAG TPA: RluA family pseudouridine synthase [Vulgatibacter sp.]|nr:RluA family pseudouridine synthase [Vulgatibacter sp.]
MVELEEHRLVVPDGDAGARLDRWAAAALGESRRKVMAAIERGHVRVDGRRARKGQPVEPGQEIVVRLPRPGEALVPQPELPLPVVHEDEAVVVVSKPSGMPTHPLEAGERGTLANALVARFPECAGAGRDPREGGVAHRLDTPTSGLVVAARSREAWEDLRAQFTARTVRKEYLALAAGAIRGRVEVEVPIGADPGNPGRMRAVPEERLAERTNAREAHTLVEVVRRFPGWTLMRCTITTGVMHQIRVHLAHLGSPVAGDDVYGGAAPRGLRRLFLHATRLAFAHPVTGAALDLRLPLPPELDEVLRSLEA